MAGTHNFGIDLTEELKTPPAIGETTPAEGSFSNINEDASQIFLVSGTPSGSIGMENDLAIDKNTGDIYRKNLTFGTLLSGIFYPTTGTDDGSWEGTPYFSNALGWLKIGTGGGGYNNSFCRFRSLNLDNNAQIVTAYVKFHAAFNDTGTPVNLNIYFNDEDNAIAPTSYTEANALALTSVVAWDAVPAWTAGNFYNTVDIATALQEVLNRAGWVNGNNTMVVIKNNGSTVRRNPDSFEATGINYPALHVEWRNPLGVYQWELEHRAGSLVRIDAGAADYNPSALTTDQVIVVNTTAAARAVTISTEDVESGSLTSARKFIIVDESGNAGTNNITITLENSGTINGDSSLVINEDNGAVTLYLTGTNGHVVSCLCAKENYGEAYIYDNSNVTVIETADTPIALRQFLAGDLNNFTFDAGSTGGITVYADYSGTVAGTVLVTSATHGLATGDIITIRGATNYNDVFAITVVSADTFYITDTWVADDGASDWDQGASLTVSAGADGLYPAYWQMSTFPAAAAILVFQIYINTTAQTKSTAERKFPINDLGSCSSSCVLSLVEGDIIWLSVQSDGTTDITNKHGNFNLRKL